MICCSFIPVLLDLLAQTDFVDCPGMLLLDRLLLLLVRQQDVGALVAGPTFQPRLGLLLIGFVALDLLASERARVLRLSKLLRILRHRQLLVLGRSTGDSIELILYLTAILALNHHFLVQQELRVVHEATRCLVVIRVLHQHCIQIVSPVRLRRGALLGVNVGRHDVLAGVGRRGQATDDSARSELHRLPGKGCQCLFVLAVAVEEALAVLLQTLLDQTALEVSD